MSAKQLGDLGSRLITRWLKLAGLLDCKNAEYKERESQRCWQYWKRIWFKTVHQFGIVALSTAKHRDSSTYCLGHPKLVPVNIHLLLTVSQQTLVLPCFPQCLHPYIATIWAWIGFKSCYWKHNCSKPSQSFASSILSVWKVWIPFIIKSQVMMAVSHAQSAPSALEILFICLQNKKASSDIWGSA